MIGGINVETTNMINSRKAIREYKGQMRDWQLDSILKAGYAGPVGMGEYENYRFTVIQDQSVLSKMNGIYDAPTVIVISVKDPGQMEFISTGCIAQNMALEAENQRVGANLNMACLGSIPEGVIPEGFTPTFAITLGLTDYEFSPRAISLKRFKTNFVK